MTVDALGNLYLICSRNQSVTIYSPDGALLRTVSTLFRPTQLAVTDGSFYVTKLWLNTDGPVVERFSLDGEPQGSLVNRPDDWRRIAMTGNFERIAISSRQTLLYSYPFPYRIIEVDAAGAILREAAGHAQHQQLRERGPDGAIVMHDGSRGLAVLPGGEVLALAMQGDDWFMDVFSEDLQFQVRLPSADFGLSAFRKIAADGAGHLYVDVAEPVPHVRKYQLTFSTVRRL